MAETATGRRNGGEPKTSSPAKAAAKPRQRSGSAKAAAKPRRSATAKAKSPAKSTKAKAPARTAKKAASKAKDIVEEAAPLPRAPKKMARKLAATAIKRMAGRVLESGAELIRHAADRAASTGAEAVGNTARKRLPIQRSVDVAVPLRVAWEEWMALERLPEGVHTVIDIEREGNVLLGRIDGTRSADWAAEVLDERERQSFAWQSYEGSDCAGLVTFHELSARLTRIELNLDVVPTSVAETARLATRLADHRAETELRRFKARLELINPDLYEDDEDEDQDRNAENPPSDETDKIDDVDEPDDIDEQDEAA